MHFVRKDKPLANDFSKSGEWKWHINSKLQSHLTRKTKDKNEKRTSKRKRERKEEEIERERD